MGYKFDREDISIPEKEQRTFSSPHFTFQDHWKENQVIHVSNLFQFGRERKYDLLNLICGSV